MSDESKKVLASSHLLGKRLAASALRALEHPRSFDARPATIHPVILREGDEGTIEGQRWGWKPAWMKSGLLINARWETAPDKSTFREAVRERRCVIPASAYYEWRRDAADKPLAKFAFSPAQGELLLMAGLWAAERVGDGQERRFLVLTRDMQRFREIHDRTPVMLTEAAAECWTDPQAPERDVMDAASCLGDDYLVPHEVTFDKALTKMDGPHLLEPLKQ